MTETKPSSIRLMEAAQADPQELAAFFEEAYGPRKSHFLMEHGDWWHRGSGGRFVVTCDGVIAGCRGIIPTVCLLEGVELSAVWAMNLFVLPRFRGMGLQRVLDRAVLEASSLRMGFPGELGAKIYVRQGYSLREDLQEMHAYLPLRSPASEGVPGLRERVGHAVESASLAYFRTRMLHYRPRRTEIIDSPDPKGLEEIFRRYVTSSSTTTLRSEEFLRWRYFGAPYRPELTFYLTSLHGRPTHYAIVRHLESDTPRARILDVFGDFEDQDGLVDLARSILREALRREAAHVEVLVSHPGLARSLLQAGFSTVYPWRFRWLADSTEIHSRFSTTQYHWVFGDSDNDSQR